MKKYAVNKQIEELLARMEPDPETGAVAADEEEIMAELAKLAMAKNDILENLGKLYMNVKSRLEEIHAEKVSLEDLSKKMKQRQGNLLTILDKECDGKRTDLVVATLCYRKSKSVEITDAEAAYRWLKRRGYSECYRIHNPEIHKDRVGKLLADGEKIPGVKQVTKTNCYLK